VVNTLELHKMSESKNDLGKVISQYTKLTDFDGIIDQLRANEVLAADKLGKESTHILMTFDVLLNVVEQDRIIDGDKIYRVQVVDNPMSLNKHLEITLVYEGVVS
jgi:SPP1 family predicted phage head-tail adaptor